MRMPIPHLIPINAAKVDRPPGKEDVGKDEGDEEGDVAHHLEREGAGAAVLDRERTLQVGQRGIIGRVVQSAAEQQGGNSQHRTGSGKPYSTAEPFPKERFPDTKQDVDHAHQEHHQDKRHLQEVVQILIRLHVDLLCLRIHSKAFRQQQIEEEEEEEDQERAALLLQVPAATGVDFFIIYIINVIEQTQHACQAENGNTEEEIPDVRDSLQPVPWRRPLGNDRHREVGQVLFIDHELRPGEERGHRRAKQQRAGNTINNKEHLIGTLAQQVSLLRLVFVRDSLQNEAKQDQHPNPIRPAEARGIEQGERGKEGTAEGDERREGELPFTPGRVEEHLLLHLRLPDLEEKRLPALHEEQENQQSAQQRYYRPPILL